MESTSSWVSCPIEEGPYQERSVDPVEIEIQHFGECRKVNHKDANGNTTGPETVRFLPAKEEPISRTSMCGPCASVASCRKLFCSVLTCGLYRVCQRLPCLISGDTSAVDTRAENTSSSSNPENGFYSDIRIGGVKVDISNIEEVEESVVLPNSKIEADSPTYFSSLPEDFIDGDEAEDVDKLITRKLMEVFSEFEINELAKCTSDSMFLRRSREISQLISDIVEEHNMEEQEAECRLVREIIRISTRKSKKRPQIRPKDLQRDSGNETWNSRKNSQKSSFNSISDGKLQISLERSDDLEARKLRNNSNQSYSPSFQETGVPVTPDTPFLPNSIKT